MTPELITLMGTVRKVIDRSRTAQQQQAQTSLVGADHLYGELRCPKYLRLGSWQRYRSNHQTPPVAMGVTI
jgi:hypothetical protein